MMLTENHIDKMTNYILSMILFDQTMMTDRQKGGKLVEQGLCIEI